MGVPMSGRVFTWLHLSDLHVGQSGQTWLWPTVKNALFNDLRSLVTKTGAIDLIIFSGDLTQKGQPEEFDRLDIILREILEVLKELGCEPPILPVPGNHDLVRPSKSKATTMLLKRWWDEPAARESFWEEGSELYSAVLEPFEAYKAWLKKHLRRQKGLQIKEGLISGDVACAVKSDGARIGS